METMKFDEASPADSSAEALAKAEGGASQEGNNSDAPQGGDQKRKKQLIWAGVILAALILAVVGWQYWQYTQSPYYQQMKAVKEIEKMAKESDKWGGKTPEETVRLFTEAVKKGDFDLASKYGDPEEIKPKLEKIKNENKMDQFLRDFGNAQLKEVPGFNGNDFHLVINDSGKEYWIMSLFKSDGGTWKIVQF